MKSLLGRMLLSQEFQSTIGGLLLRLFVQKTQGIYNYSARFLLDTQATERPHYAYCMLAAADLARRLGHNRISVVEFGVAGGNGLAFIRDFAGKAERATGVAFDIYGFDTGEGMPPPEDSRDLPHWFRESQYRMNRDALRDYVPEAKLVLGNIKDTAPSFVEQFRPAPIGALFNDVDYYSSTMHSFSIFDAVDRLPDCFLPRIFMYMDDILGTELEMYGPYNGQLAAIGDYNDSRDNSKIHLNQNLISQAHLRYRYQIYYVHLLSHPKYQEYIGGGQQEFLEGALKLRRK
jgi:hypothetical protein